MDRFRFANPELQERLGRLYDTAEVPSRVEADGSFVSEDPALAESLRSVVRHGRFPEWHTACLPSEESGERALLAFLDEQRIPYEVEEQDGERSLLLPDDASVPGSVWEAAYGPASDFEPIQPKCGFCGHPIEDAGFGEISLRLQQGGPRAVIYAHTACLARHLGPEGLHVLEALG